MDLAGLVSELFAAAQEAAPSDGPALEQAMFDRLHGQGIRLESIPGGCQLFGFASESGLAHQLDLVVALDRADAVVELKSHAGSMPKNELLRFKAATDDFYVGLGQELPHRPLYRVFGGPGRASRGVRRYAAVHGIALVEGDRWPSSVLASEAIRWSVDEAPSLDTRRLLGRLVRPIQEVLPRDRDGYRLSPWPERRSIDAVLDLQDEWSLRLWAEMDRGVVIDGRGSDRWVA